MAVLAAAQLLDELMGRNRNIAPNDKVKALNWEDPEYCKFFMVKFCPHDLFVNTRVDLGACTKVHDEEVRKLFEKAKPHHKLHYQEEFVRYCTSMVNEVERKIQKGKIRLALSGKNDTGPSASVLLSQKHQDQFKILDERINKLETDAEIAGTDGNVEQAQGLMRLCDQLKEERDNLRKQVENSQQNPAAELAAAQEKQMEVCQVCGAFLIVGDAQQRIDDHLMGKQHVGYAKLKSALEEITAVVKETKEKRSRHRDSSHERRGRNTDGDREREHDRDKRKNRSEHREERQSHDTDEKDGRDRKDKRDRSERRDRDTQKSKSDKDVERVRHRSDRDSGRRHHHHYPSHRR